MSLDPEERLQKSFRRLHDVLASFKQSPASDLSRDLKFYRTVYGSVTAGHFNGALLEIHRLQTQMNEAFLPAKYPSGNVGIFNRHQFEVIVRRRVSKL